MTTSLMTPEVGLAGEVGEFEAVAMKVDGVDVVAGVAHAEAVALALLEMDSEAGHHLIHGKATPLMVQRLKPSGGVLFGEGHVEGLVGLWVQLRLALPKRA